MVAKKSAVQQSVSGVTASASAEELRPDTGSRTRSGKGRPGKAVAERPAGRSAGRAKRAAEDLGAGKTVGAGATAVKPTGGSSGASGASGGKGPRRGVGGGTDTDTTGVGGGTQDTAGHGMATDAGAAEVATQTGATTVGAEKTPGTATEAKTAVPKARIAAVEPGDLAVRPGEEPWTPEEVEGAWAELTAEVLRLGEEITSSERSLAGLMRDSGDGAGDDQADTGTKNITREHELALAANAREMLTQYEHALQRLDAGTYGLCENCGDPIGKARMRAFPRATLCVECKQKQERRS